MARLIKHNRFLDIFYYELTDDGLLIDRGMEYYDSKYGLTHEYSDVFPLKNCMLGGVKVKCPRNPKKFLDTTYRTDVTKPNLKCVNSTWIKI